MCNLYSQRAHANLLRDRSITLSFCYNAVMKSTAHKKYIFLLIAAIIIVFGGIFLVRSKSEPEKKVHYHAGFIIVQDNKKLDFSDTKYMNISPCTLRKGDSSSEDPQLEKAHLHDNVGTVVHIERDGAKWKDLFINIHHTIDYAHTLGYINGVKVENYQEQPINLDDSLVVLIGNNDIQANLKQAITKDYIEKIGTQSKICGE